jgi:hypothetical protein
MEFYIIKFLSNYLAKFTSISLSNFGSTISPRHGEFRVLLRVLDRDLKS